MSKGGKRKASGRAVEGSAPVPTPTAPTATAGAGEQACRPLRPAPKLFAALLIGFAIWLGALLALYYKTVYPLRHQPSAGAATTRPGASDVPSAPR